MHVCVCACESVYVCVWGCVFALNIKYIKYHVAYVISVHKLKKSAAKDLPSPSNCTKPKLKQA